VFINSKFYSLKDNNVSGYKDPMNLLRFSVTPLFNLLNVGWGLSAGYQPRPQVVDRGTTARYGGQLRYI